MSILGNVIATRYKKLTLDGTDDTLHGDNEPALVAFNKHGRIVWESWYWKGEACITVDQYIECSGKSDSDKVYIKLAYPHFPENSQAIDNHNYFF